MRDRLKELIRQKSCFYVNCDGDCLKCTDRYSVLECDVERIADRLLANGVIMSPVGIGQTVYCIRYDKARKPFVKPLEIRSITTYGIGKFSVFTTRDDTWGVTAFATKEEAEKALEERSGK